MSDIRPDSFGEETMSGDERWHLEHAEFDVEADLHDYGNADLLAALRIGYALGVTDGRDQHIRETSRLADKKYKAKKLGHRSIADYPTPTQPERITDGPFVNWWRSTCSICDKPFEAYTEQKAFHKVSGHIVGAHAQWTVRAKDFEREEPTTEHGHPHR